MVCRNIVIISIFTLVSPYDDILPSDKKDMLVYVARIVFGHSWESRSHKMVTTNTISAMNGMCRFLPNPSIFDNGEDVIYRNISGQPCDNNTCMLVF
jgi:hypothetical protein